MTPRLTAGCVPRARLRCRHASNLKVHSGPFPRGIERSAAHQRKELEHLCRYITRPAIANERLALNRAGQVALTPKIPYLTGMPLVVIQYEASDRVDVGLLGSDAVVLAPDPTRSWSKRRG